MSAGERDWTELGPPAHLVPAQMVGRAVTRAVGRQQCNDQSLPDTDSTYPYAIKNQRKARNAPSRGHFVPKPLVGGFGCLELVLYGIRELAQQHYEPLILLQSEKNVYRLLAA